MAKDKELGELASLGNLSPGAGSHRTRKRLGRGIGSGLGKTAGKGHKGQRARKSGNVRPGFEGGQMKLYMRLPKRGFTNNFRTEYNVINLESLASFADGTKVDLKALHQAGLVRNADLPIKLLGRGELTKRLDIFVDRASASAQAAVEKAGGSLKLTGQVR
ncbi:MAG: 50S ribosomal protein L15 [Proteobacteria bacterium]|nr:50S ribosomal protein L15 [Pseudomonadota bacterium]